MEPAPASVTSIPGQAHGRAVFDEDWWLDAAAPGAWDRAEVRWDGVLVGEMAFHLRRRRLFRYITMPHLTRTQSPRLMPPRDKPALQRGHNLSIVRDLMSKLPPHDRFERALDVRCASLQGFVHEGLTATHLFTLRSRTGMTPEQMLSQAQDKTRRTIRRAQRECVIEHSSDLNRFIKLHRMSYGCDSAVDYDVLSRLFAAAHGRGQAEIIFTRYLDAADTAAMVIVWDATTVYSWVIARDPKQNYSGANSLLIHDAMCTANRLNRVLDLDSYVRPEVGAFLMKFGLDVEVRPFINGANHLWRGYHATRSFLRPNRYDRTFRVS